MKRNKLSNRADKLLVYGNKNLPEKIPTSPLVTFALFAYNQELYIEEAVKGAFSQEYEPLEIILSDDRSADSTYQIIERIARSYVGNHKIIVRQNNENLGLASHVSTVLDLSSGDIIVIAAGDDISYPHRTSSTVALFKSNPGCTSVLVSADIIDRNSVVTGESVLTSGRRSIEFQTLKDLIKCKAITFGAGRAIKRSVSDFFPPLGPECPTEDTPLLLRSLMCGYNVLSEVKALAYRSHPKSLSSPESLISMPIDSIIDQYCADVHFSFSAGIIDSDMQTMLMIWTKNQRKSKEIANKILMSKPLSIKQLLYSTLSSSFSIRQKLKALWISLFIARA